ncbi:MAG: hypothetical protein K0S81_2775 [Rhodospirillales bacterium]|jgi:hypothetical protein|nr:hypothetical protein [Rhodospirillales bacterium]
MKKNKRHLLKALFRLTFGFTLTADVDRTPDRRAPPLPTPSPERDQSPEERNGGSE